MDVGLSTLEPAADMALKKYGFVATGRCQRGKRPLVVSAYSWVHVLVAQRPARVTLPPTANRRPRVAPSGRAC